MKEFFKIRVTLKFKIKFYIIDIEENIKNANKLVHFGWKKEAIPVTKSKKSLISKDFSSNFLINYCYF